MSKDDQLDEFKQLLDARFSQFEERFDKRMDRLETKVDDGFAGVGEAIEQIHQTTDNLDVRLTPLEDAA